MFDGSETCPVTRGLIVLTTFPVGETIEFTISGAWPVPPSAKAP